MASRNRLGMKTFDQALFDLFEAGLVSYEEALRNADSKNEIACASSSRASAPTRRTSRRPARLKILEEEE